jgi:hypothetical protein
MNMATRIQAYTAKIKTKIEITWQHNSKLKNPYPLAFEGITPHNHTRRGGNFGLAQRGNVPAATVLRQVVPFASRPKRQRPA